MENRKLIKRPYSLSDYDFAWTEQFKKISGQLKEIFGSEVIAIEHVGSTSVPGMKAKPVIDVLVVVENIRTGLQKESSMTALGYKYEENYIAPNTVMFYKEGLDKSKIENIHVCENGSPKHKQFVVMRDYLISHPLEAKKYEDLKTQLSQEFPGDYIAYREGKQVFLEEMEKRAYEWESEGSVI